MSLWSLARSGGRIVGTVLELCLLWAIGLGIGSAWLYGAGWNWKAWPAMVIVSPLAFWALVFIFTYARSGTYDHEGLVPLREWRTLSVYAALACATPVAAYRIGGWPRAHQFAVFSVVLGGAWLSRTRLARSALDRAGDAIGRLAERLPPGSSSTRLS